VESTYDYDFHNSPQRQYLVILDGIIEIETSLGEKRIFKEGEVVLLEDTTGKGHRTKNMEIAERRSLFIPC
jgi:quercetin dioxygenase-like cupin family protein